MKLCLFAVSGIVATLAASSCAKKAVTAAHPADTAPVAQASPAPERREPVSTPAPARVQQSASTTPAPRSTTMPPQVRQALNEILARMEDALFDYDKATIRTDATAALRDDGGLIRSILADYPSQKLIIEGHCDERGSDEYNMALGDRRARAAEEFLVSMGVSGNQLEVISFGKDRPVCTDKSEACYQKNRRAHLTAAP